MKRISMLAALALVAAACSGTIDPEDVVNDTENPGDTETPGVKPEDIPDAFTEPFTLSVDKAEVDANGIDYVTFSLKDAYDREMLTDKNTLQNINIVSVEGIRVPRMETTATFIANGTYNFTASFKGKKSNTVQVVAKNRAKYEVYHRNVGLFKCTSVWCTACPSLGKALHRINDDAAAHSVVIAVHGNFNDKDPFSLYVGERDLGSYMMQMFGGNGWPTLIYDLSYASVGSSPTSDLESEIMKRRIEAPATCGIKVNSVAVEGTELKVSASVKTSSGGDYDLACAVLRNGLYYSGGYSINDDGIYDEVLVALSESGLKYTKGETLAVDEEYTEVFSFNFGENVPSAKELESYYVAVYAHRKGEYESVMDNIVTCGYGETVDYHLND